MICDYYNAGKLTPEEAFSNLGEMADSGSITKEHGLEIVTLILGEDIDKMIEELMQAIDEMVLI